MTGHCSNCHRVWRLQTRQGVCPWCSREAICLTSLTKPRRLKVTRTRSRKQAGNGGNGYHELPEPYLTYYGVALRFAHKSLTDDREDLLHTIIEGLAKVGQRKASQGEDFTQPAMYRVAEHIKDWYWYRHYSYNNGLDCRHCTKAQQAKCRWNWGHSNWAYSDCHRAIQLESLNQPITDEEGNLTELADLIADDRALDLEAWVDARTFLIGAPIRLKAIARKRLKGDRLTGADRQYLSKLRKRQQLSLARG